MGRRRTAILVRTGFAAALHGLLACGDDLPRKEGHAESAGSFCERYDAIAEKLGCRPLGSECPALEAQCEQPGRRLARSKICN